MAEKKQKNYKDMTDKELFKLMAGPSQIKRKNAAKVIVVRVQDDPEKYKSNIPDLIDALSRPEAQTRWEALTALTYLVPVDPKACKGALEGAEEALFDEKTSLIRESAVRFLARYGASSTVRSKEVWPLLKEALQQFHGEIEFDKILNRLTFFAAGKLDEQVKKEFRKEARSILNSVGGPTKVRIERILQAMTAKGLKVSSSKTKAKDKASDAKKTNSKKPAAKKSTTKKSAAKKTTAKKTTTKKIVAKKPATKKTSEKKTAAKKPVAKKSTTKSSTKTTTAKKATKKSTQKKASTAKKTATKKPAAKKLSDNKNATKETNAKKLSDNKSAAKKSGKFTKKLSSAGSKLRKKVTKKTKTNKKK